MVGLFCSATLSSLALWTIGRGGINDGGMRVGNDDFILGRYFRHFSNYFDYSTISIGRGQGLGGLLRWLWGDW